MTLEEHERESLALFGRPWTEVHLWLNESAGRPGTGTSHRRLRHHKAGIREAERLFGEEGALAARLHVISDLKQEGWTEDRRLPEDERDFVGKGFY